MFIFAQLAEMYYETKSETTKEENFSWSLNKKMNRT